MRTRNKKLLSIIISLSIILSSFTGIYASPLSDIDNEDATIASENSPVDVTTSSNALSVDLISGNALLNYSGRQMGPALASDGKYYAVKGIKFNAGKGAYSNDKQVLKVNRKGYVKIGNRWGATLYSPIYGDMYINSMSPRLTDKKASLQVGESMQIGVLDLPEGIPVAWVSSNPNVIQVLNGKCVAVGIGKANVRAYICGKAFVCEFEVEDKAGSTILYNAGNGRKGTSMRGLNNIANLNYQSPDGTIVVKKRKVFAKGYSKTPITLDGTDGHKFVFYANDTTPISKTFTLKRGENVFIMPEECHELLNWKVKDPSIAYVSEYGVLVGQAPGKTKVTAKTGGKKISVKVIVTDELISDNKIKERTVRVIDPINGNDGFTVDISGGKDIEVINDKDRENTVSEDKPEPDPEPDPDPVIPDPEPEPLPDPDDLYPDIPSGNNIGLTAGLYKNKVLVKTWAELKKEGLISMKDNTLYGSVDNQKNLNGALVISDATGVRYIGKYAFERCSFLTGISIPYNVTKIGEYAFQNSGIRSLIITKNISEIGEGAFTGTEKLKEITFEKGIKTIPKEAFSFSGIKELNLPLGVEVIEDGAFYWCSNLSSVTFPKTLVNIGENAFGEDVRISELRVPKTVKTIGDNAFKSLPMVYYSGTATGSPWGARGLSNKTEDMHYLHFDTNGSGEYFSSLLISEGSKVGSLPIPNYPGFAFKGWWTESTGGVQVTKDTVMGNKDMTVYAHYGLDNIRYKVLHQKEQPDGGFITVETETGRGAEGDTVIPAIKHYDGYEDPENNGAEIVAPDDTTVIILKYKIKRYTISYNANGGEGASKKHTKKHGEDYTISQCDYNYPMRDFIGWNAEPDGEGIWYQPDEIYTDNNDLTLYAQWQMTPGLWNSEKTILKTSWNDLIENGVLRITEDEDNNKILRKGLTTITPDMFEGYLILPDSGIDIIGNYVFSDDDNTDEDATCDLLTGISIPNTVTKIGEYTFKDCTSLKDINLPDSISVIKEGAFEGCTSLTGELILPKSLTTLGDNAFKGCNKITETEMPLNIDRIGNNTFYGCSGLQTVSMPYVSEIGDNAFFECINLTRVESSAETIGEGAFNRCSGLNAVILHNNLTEIKDYAFANCGNIEGFMFLGTQSEWDNVTKASNYKDSSSFIVITY